MHRSLSAEGSGTLRLTEMPTATGDTSKGEIWVYDRERDTRVPLPSGDPERMATPKQIGSYDIVGELGRQTELDVGIGLPDDNQVAISTVNCDLL